MGHKESNTEAEPEEKEGKIDEEDEDMRRFRREEKRTEEERRDDILLGLSFRIYSEDKAWYVLISGEWLKMSLYMQPSKLNTQ